MPICLPSFVGTVAPASGGGAFANEYSITLDGTNDYMATANSVLNFYNTGGSISAWVKPSSVTGTLTEAYKNRSIINKGNVYLSLNIDEAGYPALYFYDGAVREVVATTQVSTSSWMHICATWSTTGSSIYVNGTSEATSSNTPANITSSQTGATVYMGRTPTAWDYYGGLIDELAVFNTELSSSNVSTIYNSGVPNDISSLSPVNWWRMGDNDGGTGTNITDQGSGSNNTTLFNSTTFSTDVPTAFANQYSVTLDGTDDSVLLGDSSTTLFNYGTANFTMSIWFKPDSSGDYKELWCGHDAGGWLMYLGNSNVFGFYGDDTSLKSAGTVNLNAWNHGAVIRTSTTLKLYLNGNKILDDTIASTATFNKYTGGRAGTVGMGNPGNNAAYDGEVDEAAVWLSALSDGGVSVGSTAGGDIATIYNSGVPNDISSLNPIGWWRMGESNSGTGTIVTDIGAGVGGTNVDGTLSNGASFVTDVPS